jgi:uncharacterized protein (TIGR02268 family)
VSLPPLWIVRVALTLLPLPALAQPRSEALAPPVRRLEPSVADSAREVGIAPGHPTTLLFDAALDTQAVERACHELGFQRVAVAKDTIMLLPAPGLKAGQQLRLMVSFADGQPPGGVPVVFVVRPAAAETLVEVSRGALPVSSCQAALTEEQARSAEKDEALALKDAEIAALRAEAGGLTGLVASGRLTDGGVRSMALVTRAWRPPEQLTYLAAHLYVARGLMAVDVELKLRAQAAAPWVPGAVTLALGTTSVPVRSARLVEGSMLKPGDTAHFVVEWEAPEALPGKPPPVYRLKVMDQSGMQHIDALCLGRGKC